MSTKQETEDQQNEDFLLLTMHYALTHGLVMFPQIPLQNTTPNTSPNIKISQLPSTVPSFAQSAPFSLIPSPVPRNCFEISVKLAPLFGILLYKLNDQHEFILSCLKAIPESDTFTRRLIKIYSKIINEGVKQKIQFGLTRSDYMLHQPEGKDAVLQQVELNTIAASMCTLSNLVSDMHRNVLSCTNVPPKLWKNSPISTYSEKIEIERIPPNNNIESIADAFSKAFQLYNKNDAVLMMIIQTGERNASDQRLIQFKLWEKYKINTIRRTLTDIGERGRLNEKTSALEIDGFTVAISYYRAGYGPSDYPSELEWEAREMVERSISIKCPNISYHLLGTKKIQQQLAAPGVLEKYFDDDEEGAKLLRGCFAGLWPLGDEEQEEKSGIVKEAIKNPDLFVLKPQREGGGNNLYGSDISNKLQTLSASERAAYILMSKIQPSPFKATLCRLSQIYEVEMAASELGIYNWFLSDADGKIVMNDYGGYLLRTKVNDQEAGLMAGVGAVDSPYLID